MDKKQPLPMAGEDYNRGLKNISMSVGSFTTAKDYPPKKATAKIRGTGAATKGTMFQGDQ
jgi:hypothetical protein|tara:strand:+ start:984 stop:1163 length:180 start_codon:yes stop_codon:yes gene_type:complete